jgi:hypothetical protein
VIVKLASLIWYTLCTVFGHGAGTPTLGHC